MIVIRDTAVEMTIVEPESMRGFHSQHKRRRVCSAVSPWQRPLQREVLDSGTGFREIEHCRAVAFLTAACRRVDEVVYFVFLAVESATKRGGILWIAGIEPPALTIDVGHKADNVARKIFNVHGLHEIAQFFKRINLVLRRPRRLGGERQQ